MTNKLDERISQIVAIVPITPDGHLRLKKAVREHLGLGDRRMLYLDMLSDVLGNRFVSLLLYGSAVFDDLAPGYGDLDFLATMDDDLTERECRRLIELRKPLRDGKHARLATMPEGPFLPRAMLDPSHRGNARSPGGSQETSNPGRKEIRVQAKSAARIKTGADVRGMMTVQTNRKQYERGDDS